MIKSLNRSLFGFNLKFKYALVNASHASSTSACVAFSFPNTSWAASNSGNIACHEDAIYLSSSNPNTLFTIASNNDLSTTSASSKPFIAACKLSYASSTSSCIAFSLFNTVFAFVNASCNADQLSSV